MKRESGPMCLEYTCPKEKDEKLHRRKYNARGATQMKQCNCPEIPSAFYKRQMMQWEMRCCGQRTNARSSIPESNKVPESLLAEKHMAIEISGIFVSLWRPEVIHKYA